MKKGQTVKEQIDELLEVVNLTGVVYKNRWIFRRHETKSPFGTGTAR